MPTMRSSRPDWSGSVPMFATIGRPGAGRTSAAAAATCLSRGRPALFLRPTTLFPRADFGGEGWHGTCKAFRIMANPASFRRSGSDDAQPSPQRLRPRRFLVRDVARRCAAGGPRSPRRAPVAGVEAPRRERRRGAPRPRHHLHRLFRARRGRPRPSLRLHPARAVGGGLGAHRGGRVPEGRRAQPPAARHLPRAEDPGGRGDPGRPHPRQRRTTGRSCAAWTCRTAPMSTSAARTSCATGRASSWCSKTTPARRRASAMSSRTGT